VQGPDSTTGGEGGLLLDRLLLAAGQQEGVTNVVSWRSTGDSMFRSRDDRTTFFLVALEDRDAALGAVSALRQGFDSVLRRTADREAYRVRVTGRTPLDLDIRTITADDAHRNERRLIPITMAVLVLAFGALVAATLPVIVGVMAITIALAAVGVLSLHMPMSVFVLNMVSMIGLGVWIDYSLLVVTRFREELNAGLRHTEAAVRTFRTAGAAVVTSGATVVVGFAALLLTPLTETRSVGVAGLVV